MTCVCLYLRAAPHVLPYADATPTTPGTDPDQE